VNNVDAQLKAAKAGVKQSQASLEVAEVNALKAKDAAQQAQAALNQVKGALANARAGLAKARAAADLAKTAEMVSVNLQKVGIGAIGLLKVEKLNKSIGRKSPPFILGRARRVKDIEQFDSASNAANKLLRTYVLQMEALATLRCGGKHSASQTRPLLSGRASRRWEHHERPEGRGWGE
jgi:hypothetical protein